MAWATNLIEKLKAGETVSFRPTGNSMTPKIKSRQLCTVIPILHETIEVGDIVLCKVQGRQYLHFVNAIKDNKFQIANNFGHINGWVTKDNIFGKLIKVE